MIRLTPHGLTNGVREAFRFVKANAAPIVTVAIVLLGAF